MRRVHPNIVYRNDIDLPLFAWACGQDALTAQLSPPAPTLPCWQVRAIARETGLSLSRAKLMAELLGIDPEDLS
jgi:hypothetical protein